MKKYIFQILLLLVIQVSFGQALLTKQSPLPCLNKHFSIVAHIVAMDNMGTTGVQIATIENAISTLNKNFEPICVSFDICKVDTIDNYLYDNLSIQDWKEMQVQFNEDRRINMYFVTDATVKQDFCGFATQGGINTYNEGGIVIGKGICLSANAITHQMGHYFNLLHTFEGNGTELVDGSNCTTQGDLICDTPADPFNPKDSLTVWVDKDCIFIDADHLDANGAYYQPDVGNFMSYYNCKCGFTHGQYLRMAEAIKTSEMW